MWVLDRGFAADASALGIHIDVGGHLTLVVARSWLGGMRAIADSQITNLHSVERGPLRMGFNAAMDSGASGSVGEPEVHPLAASFAVGAVRMWEISHRDRSTPQAPKLGALAWPLG